MDTFVALLGILALLVVDDCYASGTPVRDGECPVIRFRRASRVQGNITTSYVCHYYYWGCSEISTTTYRTVYYTQYYRHAQCCLKYTRNNGTCKKAVMGFDKPIYYLEKDGCTMSICARIFENDVGSAYDGQIHILNYEVTSNYGSRVTDGKIFLSSSIRRQCINMAIDLSYRLQGDLNLTLTEYNIPNYAVISPSSSIIRPRADVSIGFEETEMDVYENAGRISLCVRILRPISLDRIELVNFYLYLTTFSISGDPDLDFQSINSTIRLSKYRQRTCKSISIVFDHIHEEDEEFHAVLTGKNLPDYVTITPSTARIKIINIKRKFSIGFNLAELEVVESASSVDICISSSTNTFHNGAVTLEVIIPSIHQNDLSFLNAMVHFNDTTTRQCLPLKIINDNSLEGIEVAVLMLEVESTTEPFYMDVSPSFMKLKIIDDDSITIGFNSSVVEVEKGSTVKICASVKYGVDLLSGAVHLIVNTKEGTADNNHYFAFGGLFSTILPENCFPVITHSYATSDNQPRTFSMSLDYFPFSNADKVILDPQTVLIKITDRGTSSCTSGRHHCETGCSDIGTWSKLPSGIFNVSEDVCMSKNAVTKSRVYSSSTSCTRKGQFCIESMEEKIIRSFLLGISPQLYEPEAVSEKCQYNSVRLNSTFTEPLPVYEGCQSRRPSTCHNRSILLVLDTSRPVGPQTFQMMTDAMSELTQHFCGNVQVAVAKFNKHAYLDLCFNCLTKSRFDMSRFIRNDVKYEYTGSGKKNFENATKSIYTHAFSGECGNHTQSDCIDIIYVTNGDLSSNNCSQVKTRLPTQDSICNKSKIFAIGVGKNVNITKLHCIASAATKNIETVFQFDTFIDLRKYISSSVQYLYKKKKYCNVRNNGNINICDKDRIDIPCDN